jgi:hypothetical protein
MKKEKNFLSLSRYVYFHASTEGEEELKKSNLSPLELLGNIFIFIFILLSHSVLFYN